MRLQAASGRNRLLIKALAASAAVHAALLWPALPLRGAASVALHATLRGAAPTSAARDTPIAAAPTVPQRAAARTSPPARRRGAGHAVQEVAAASVLAVAGDGAHAAAPASDGADRPVPAAPAGQDAAPAPSAAVSVDEASGGIDSRSLTEYRIALIRAGHRSPRYPRRAIEEGLAGEVEVVLRVGADGWPAGIVLARSSGHRRLDNAAREMIAYAAQRAAVPQALRGREFAVDIPVLFVLKEQ
jgi:protein TonB